MYSIKYFAMVKADEYENEREQIVKRADRGGYVQWSLTDDRERAEEKFEMACKEVTEYRDEEGNLIARDWAVMYENGIAIKVEWGTAKEEAE